MSFRAAFEDWVPYPIERVFLFFANPENLPRLMPPSTDTRIEGLRLVDPPAAPISSVAGSQPIAGVGSEIDTSFRILPFLPLRAQWVARITEFQWNHHFADVQIRGPFRSWHHRHELSEEFRDGVRGTMVADRIEYAVGLMPLDKWLERVISKQIARTFAERQKILPGLLRRQAHT